jgi:hypothetical protein
LGKVEDSAVEGQAPEVSIVGHRKFLFQWRLCHASSMLQTLHLVATPVNTGGPTSERAIRPCPIGLRAAESTAAAKPLQ